MLKLFKHRMIRGFLLSKVAEINMVVFLVIFWIYPDPILAISPDAGEFVELLFMFEFLFGHASVGVGIGMAMANDGPGRKVLWGIFAFYGLFFVALGFAGFYFETIFYFTTVLARIYRAIDNPNPEKNVKYFATGFARVMLLLLSVIPGIIIPWPNLGLPPNVFKGSGILIEQPGRWMVTMITYYASVRKVEMVIEGFIDKSDITFPRRLIEMFTKGRK